MNANGTGVRPATGVALSPLLLVAYWQEYATEPDAISLASNSVSVLPTLVNPIKFVPLTTAAPLVAPVAELSKSRTLLLSVASNARPGLPACRRSFIAATVSAAGDVAATERRAR